MKRIKEKGIKLIRASEKYTKTDMTYLLKGGFWVGLAQGVSSVLALLLAVVFGNVLPLEVYGTYKFVVSLTAIVGAVGLSGMGPAIARSVAQGADEALRAGTASSIKWNSIIFFITAGIAAYYYIQGNLVLTIVLLFAAVFLPLRKTFGLYDAYLQGKKDFKSQFIYGTISDALPICALIVTALLTHNIVAIMFVFFSSYTLTQGFFYFLTVRKNRVEDKRHHETVAYGKHLSLITILANIANQLDNVLLFHYLGPIQVAIYSFATAPPREIFKLNRVLNVLTLPKVGTRSISDLKKTMAHKMSVVFLASLSLFGVYVIIAPYLYRLVFPQYIDSIFFSQVFALSILFFPSTLLLQTFVGHMRKSELYILNTVVPGIKIFSFVILLPILGIWGAILGILSARLVQFLLLLFFFRRM